MSSLTLYHFLVDPLRAVLCGESFTALLTQSSRPGTQASNHNTDDRVQSNNCRYIATRFKLLDDPNVRLTVYSLLHHRLLGTRSSGQGTGNCETEPGVCEEGSTTVCTGSSLLSCVGSPGTQQQSRHIVLESYHSNAQSFTTRLAGDGGPPRDSEESKHSSCPSTFKSSFVQSLTSTPNSFTTSSVDHSIDSVPATFSGSLEPSKSAGSGDCTEDSVSLCEDVLDELLSTWKEDQVCHRSSNSPRDLCSKLPPGDYTETLPDSESFLDEFQCSFEPTPTNIRSNTQPGLKTRPAESSVTTSKRLSSSQSLLRSKPHCTATLEPHTEPTCLHLTPLPELGLSSSQFTPELFPSSNLSTTSASFNVSEANENLSPELFSSPECSAAAFRSGSRDGPTPTIIKTVPKRRLIHPLQNSQTVHTSYENTHTPFRENSTKDTTSYSPELFP